MAGTSHRTLVWLVLSVVVGIGLLAAGGIATVHQAADRHRVEEVLMVRIEGLAHRLVGLSLEVELDHAVSPRRLTEMAQVEDDLSENLSELELRRGPKATQDVRQAFDAYADAVEGQLSLIAAGKDSEAHELANTIVAQRYAQLLEATATTREQHQAVARRASNLASAGIVAIISVAVLLITGVLVGVERVRRRLLEREKRAMRDNEARLLSLVGNAADVIQIIDESGIVRWSSPAISRSWGIPPESSVGASWDRWVHAEDRIGFVSVFRQAIHRPGATMRTEVRVVRSDGSTSYCELALTNLLEERGVLGLVGTYHDVTERKALEQELRSMAYRDPLTDLPNRLAFLRRLTEALTKPPTSDSRVAVLFLDLDNFKLVNDCLGHHRGDELLVAVTARLRSVLPPPNLASRLGGDEFAILLVDEKAANAEETAREILSGFAMPFMVGERETFVSASVGIAYSDRAQTDPEALLREADMAMYRSKLNGKGQVEVFRADMNAAVQERMELETDLRRAVERQELHLQYQPLVDLATGNLTGLEALLRWRHPDRGAVPPSQFIPIAEETGLIESLGAWALHEACRQAVLWSQPPSCLGPVTISVNLSARQFQQRSGLVRTVSKTLSETGLPPSQLVLEITESAMMNDPLTTATTIQELRGLGVGIAIDDFGTVYSSLGYLKTFAVCALKIDKSFIADLGNDQKDTAIVEAVIDLGRALGISVTAEGTETSDQVQVLRSLGCQYAQGNYYARPMDAAAVHRFMHLSSVVPATPKAKGER